MNAHLQISAPLRRLVAFGACAAFVMLAPMAADRIARTAAVQSAIVAPTGPGSIPGSRIADVPASLVTSRIASAFDVQDTYGVQMASAVYPRPDFIAGLPVRLAMR